MANVTKIIGGLKSLMTDSGDKALPLALPRANVPSAYINQQAERVARQMLGEHVTSGKARDTTNLAGRSMKESQRVKGLDYKVTPTGTVAEEVVHTPRVGDINVGTVGDQTISDSMLESVGDIYGINSQQEGGGKYALGQRHIAQPEWWKSTKEPADRFQRKVNRLNEFYEPDRLIGTHVAMGPTSNNFAMHLADANMKAIDWSKVTPKNISIFDDVIRTQYRDPKTKQRVPFPEWPGLADQEGAFKAMQENTLLRKWFNDRMKTPKVTKPLGLPNGLDIQYAITEPSLRDMEINMTGLMTGELQPNALTEIGGSPHNTYSTRILSKEGTPVGGQEVLTPFTLAYPDASQHIATTQRPADFTGTIQKVVPHQIVDDQFINQYNQYRERIKELTGKKKGGEVRKHGHSFEEDLAAAFAEVIAEHNPKPMHGEITVKTSAPVKMAMGGAVTSDYNTVPDDNDEGAVIQNPSNFATGGRASIIDALDKVSDEESIDHQIERYLNRVRLNGSGGKDAYGTNVGGRLGLDIPLSKDVTISPYLEGYTYKPTNQPIGGQVTGAGANLTMRFKDGGVARKRNVDELHPLAEAGFQRDIKNSPWYAEFVRRYQEQPDIREGGDYNYRKAWAYGAEPQRDPYDQNSLHWPSALPNGDMLKSPDHPTAWKEYYMRANNGVNPDSVGATKDEFEARQEKPIHMGFGGSAVNSGKRALRGLIGTGVAEGNKTSIIKDTGGNWLGGSVEEHLSPLRQTAGLARGATPSERLAKYNQLLEAATDDASRALIQRDINTATREDALDKWIGGNLTKYVKNQMGTAEDPVRKLAEQNIIHTSPEVYRGDYGRSKYGMPQLGVSPRAKAWENLTDTMINPSTVADQADIHRLFNYGKEGATSHPEPWMAKVSPYTKVYGISETTNPRNFGYDHILDVLREDLQTGRLLPENLNKMNMEHAVRRTYQYDQELAKRMSEASILAREGLPVRKEYPKTGFRWLELNKPGSFAAESDAMGHSARGYEPPKGHPDWVEGSGRAGHEDYGLGGWEAIKSGNAKMYSLVDKEGRSHATIETEKFGGKDSLLSGDALNEVEPGLFQTYLDQRQNGGIDGMHQWLREKRPDIAEMHRINQIKPPGNYWDSEASMGRIAENPKYMEDIQPYLQDFVKTGKWSRVNDLHNTGLIKHDSGKYISKAEMDALSRKHFGESSGNKPDASESPEQYFGRVSRYNQEQLSDADRAFVEDWKAGNFPPQEEMAKGGLVHMAPGGVVKWASQLAKTINSHKMESMSGEQWMKWLNANAPKSAKKEALASGTLDWLPQQGKVSKGAIIEHMKANAPEINVKKFANNANPRAKARFEELRNEGEVRRLTSSERDEMNELEQKLEDTPKTKFDEHVLPGGKNYREMTLSTSNPTADDYIVPAAHTYRDNDADLNRILHMRMNDRPYDGGNALNIEELQSDWAQQGRSSGFKGDKPSNPDKGLPKGPYVTDTEDWTRLGLHNAIKEAAEQGHNAVTWTGGDAQANRWSNEGLKHYYDTVMPSVSNDILKKMGVAERVGEFDVGTGVPHQGFNITPEMLDYIKQNGMPRFQDGGQAHYNKAEQVVESTQDLIDKFVEMYEKASGKEPKPPKEVFRDPWHMKDGGAPPRRDVSELIPFSPHLPSAVSAGLDWVKGKVLDEAKTYSNPRAIPDVAANVAADWAGMPVDIAKILADVADYGGEKVAHAITGRSSKKLSDLVKEDEHEKPTFGSSEYIKDYLKEKGVTTGTERPISEFAAFPVAPALLRGATRTGKKYLNQPPHLTQKEYDDILSGQSPRKLRNVDELIPIHMGYGGLAKRALRGLKGTGVDEGKKLTATVWHGSPHTFGKFDASKIGTGEGAQAYGHGHYVADARKVGQQYKDDVSDAFHAREIFPRESLKSTLVSRLSQDQNVIRGNKHLSPQERQDIHRQIKSIDDEIHTIKQAFDPSLYKIDLPDEHIAKMLDWDKPLSEQPHIQKALHGTKYQVGINEKEAERIAEQNLNNDASQWADEWAYQNGYEPDITEFMNNANWDKYVRDARKSAGGLDSSMTGSDLYNLVKYDEGYRAGLFDPENYQVGTSEHLNSLGIPGNKYLDALSRGAGEGSSNYVVFPGNEDMLTILERNPSKASGGAVHMGVGGIAKAIKPSELSKLKEYMLKTHGVSGAQRVERAADEIPNLEKMYKQRALISAFGGDNASAVMVIKPEDFEKYSSPLSSSYRPQNEIDERVKYLRSVGRFDDVPYLQLYKHDVGEPIIPGHEAILKSRRTPHITGHEGRHRSQALAENGEQSSLVRMIPRAGLREMFPRSSQPEYLDALQKEMAKTDNMVRPETYEIDGTNQSRPAILLPEMFSEGGVASKRNVNELHPLY